MSLFHVLFVFICGIAAHAYYYAFRAIREAEYARRVAVNAITLINEGLDKIDTSLGLEPGTLEKKIVTHIEAYLGSHVPMGVPIPVGVPVKLMPEGGVTQVGPNHFQFPGSR